MIFLFHPKPYLIQPNAQVGLGLLCLATYARELGAEVRVVNAQAWTIDRAVEAVPSDVTVCMGGCLVDRPIIDDLSAKLRAKGCYVVAGGPVADGEALGPRCASLIVRGAGEPFVHRYVQEGWRPKGRVNSPYIVDYGAYPIPDRRLLGGQFGGNIYHPRSGRQTPVSTTLLTARGCRYSCAFCRSGSRREFYEYPRSRIRAELEQIVELGIRDVRLADDNLASGQSRFARLCELLGQHGIHWRASLRTYPNDVSLYRTMAESGCIEVSLGVESADPAVLRTLRKGSRVESNERAVANAVASGIPHVRALMMMSTPGETAETLDLNKRWAEAHPEVTICLSAFVPFPGTAIFQSPERFGCRLEMDLDNLNFFAFQGDGALPGAHVGIINGMSRDELTRQLRAFRGFLEERGQINEG
jgi:radical SAM superfamily enzyme YgiQ (UPF0313 family)